LNLALCHTVIIEKLKNGKAVYNASSPDELALVNAAKYFGVEFIERDHDNNVTINFKGEIRKYQLLNIIEFSSARKRMTMILRQPDGTLIAMGKGADSTLIPLLKKDT